MASGHAEDRSLHPSQHPILVMAASRVSFSVRRKHERIADLILAYLWHLRDGNPAITYALTYKEALGVAEQMGWTRTSSWRQGGYYANNEPGERLRERLAPYLATPERWRFLMRVR